VSETRRFLQFANWRTGERAENPGKVEITGKSEREVEKIELGMLRNCDVENGWFVDDLEEPSDA
jgi:hypothetical protein